MPTSKSRAEYMAARRQAMKDKLLGKVPGQPPQGDADVHPERHLCEVCGERADGAPRLCWKHLTDKTAQPRDTRVDATEIGNDRANGLPRTNYYGDWVGTIQGMNGHAIQKILDHPAVKTSSRDKK